MCSVYDRYTGKVVFVSKEELVVLNKRNVVKGIPMVKPRYEFLGEVNSSFVN